MLTYTSEIPLFSSSEHLNLPVYNNKAYDDGFEIRYCTNKALLLF